MIHYDFLSGNGVQALRSDELSADYLSSALPILRHETWRRVPEVLEDILA